VDGVELLIINMHCNRLGKIILCNFISSSIRRKEIKWDRGAED
jgi:hypothetical protein